MRKAYNVEELIEVLESFEDRKRPVWIEYHNEDTGYTSMEPVNAVAVTRSYKIPGVLIEHIPKGPGGN